MSENKEKKGGGLNPAGLGAGLAIGVALGVALDNLAIGLALGIVFGASFSLALGNRDKDSSGGDNPPSDSGS